jgi:hypothetical protein
MRGAEELVIMYLLQSSLIGRRCMRILRTALALLALPIALGAQQPTGAGAPTYIRIDSGWIGLFGQEGAYARYLLAGPDVQLQDAGHILLRQGLGLSVSFVAGKELAGPDPLTAHASWEAAYWRGRAARVDTATRADLAAGRSDVRVTQLTMHNAAGATLGIDLVGLRAPSGVYAFGFSPAGPAADSAVTRFVASLRLVPRPLGPEELAHLSDSLRSRSPGPSAPPDGGGCDLLTAALRQLSADSANTVLVDQTGIGSPTFALNAYTTLRRGDTTLARIMVPLRELNRTRVPLPDCLSGARRFKLIADSTLFGVFRSPGDRWAAFRERFAPATQFALFSQPLIRGDTAFVYVGLARGNLDGRGVILRMVRDAAGNWVKQSEMQIWIS